MKALFAFLCMAIVSAGCVEGYEEIREGRTAEVHLCGDNWEEVLVDDAQRAIDDWNRNVSSCFGHNAFELGATVIEERTFEDDDIDDGLHCIYRVTAETSTESTRELKDGNPKAAAIFVANDDIVVFSNLDDDHLDNWALWATIAHELGHGGGLGHVHEDAAVKSVMKPKRHTSEVQAVDTEAFCELNGRSP